MKTSTIWDAYQKALQKQAIADGRLELHFTHQEAHDWWARELNRRARQVERFVDALGKRIQYLDENKVRMNQLEATIQLDLRACLGMIGVGETTYECINRVGAMLDDHPRAVKLMTKRKPFIVIAVDEPYFKRAYDMIREHEQAKDQWDECDEERYRYLVATSAGLVEQEPNAEAAKLKARVKALEAERAEFATNLLVELPLAAAEGREMLAKQLLYASGERAEKQKARQIVDMCVEILTALVLKRLKDNPLVKAAEAEIQRT